MVENSDEVTNKIHQKRNNFSVVYNERLKGQVRDLSSGEMSLRILSFLLDAIFMFWPSIIFIISILLLTSPMNFGGEIIRNTFELSLIYIISILTFNTVSSLYFKGQTIGMRYYGLKVVKENNDELTTSQILIRELMGVSVPWVCILLTYTLMGTSIFFISFLAFVSINFVIIFTDKKHRSLIDMMLHTKLVLLPDDEVAFVSNLEETAVENNIEVAATNVEQHNIEKQEILKEIKVEEPVENQTEIKTELPKENKFNNKNMVSSLKDYIKIKPKEVMKEPIVESIKEELPTQQPEITKVEKIELPKEKVVKANNEPKQETQNIKVEDSKPIEKKQNQDESKPIAKEKSVTEIISEAVSVVDIALESRKKDYPVNIVKPIKPEIEEFLKEKPIKQKEETPQSIEPNQKELEKSVEPLQKNENISLKKNNKKKNGKTQKEKLNKSNIKVKDIKSISSVKKGK